MQRPRKRQCWQTGGRSAYFVVALLAQVLILQLPAYSKGNKRMQSESPITDGSARDTTLRAGISVSELESDLKKLGITLARHKPGVLPAVVSNVEPGSPAMQGNIEPGDLVTKLERDRGTNYVTIKRDGNIYRAVIRLDGTGPVVPVAHRAAFGGNPGGSGLRPLDPGFGGFRVATHRSNAPGYGGFQVATPGTNAPGYGGFRAAAPGSSAGGFRGSAPMVSFGGAIGCRCGCYGNSLEGYPAPIMKSGIVRFQMKIPSIGGNPCQMNMTGSTNMYADDVLRRGNAVAICNGGYVPQGKVWIIRDIKYSGSASGDNNGPGRLLFVVGGQRIIDIHRTNAPISGEWQGQIGIRHGEECSVCVTLSNSSQCDITLYGQLVND